MPTPPRKTASKKPAPERQKKISAAKEFRKRKHHEVELPSGEICLAKRPGPEVFLSKGMLPDSLTPIVTEAVRSGKGLAPEKLSEMSNDLDAISDMLDGVDRIVAEIVVEPKTMYHKDSDGNIISESDREEDYLYTDEVELDDKMFLFNFAVGGSSDLEQFRAELAAGVGDVQSGP